MALNDLQGRWLRVNPALCELFGLSEEELTATDFQALTHPDDLDQDFDVMGRMMAGEADACQFEKRFFHKSGRTIWCQLSGALIRDTDGDPRYFVTQIQDVTEQREMDRMKSEFISVISHELRTPLTSINGALGLLRGTAAESLPDSARKLLDIADRNCRQLVVLINDTLDMDKIASGQMRLESRAQALAPLLEDAVKANVAYAGSFGVELHLEPVAGDIRVDVDSNRLTQVLSNLLSNAAKFSEPGDTVNIAVVTAGNRVRITVSDEGCGIPEEFRTRIFGRFEQADSSATRAKGGTGLGLHISKQLVELMHGQIGVRGRRRYGVLGGVPTRGRAGAGRCMRSS